MLLTWYEGSLAIQLLYAPWRFSNEKYLPCLVMKKADVHIIFSSTNLVKDLKKLIYYFQMNRICWYFYQSVNGIYQVWKIFSERNIILRNRYHIETTNDENFEYFEITIIVSSNKYVLRKLLPFSSVLYHTNFSIIELHAIVNQKFTDADTFIIWYDQLGYPGLNMMQKNNWEFRWISIKEPEDSSIVILMCFLFSR